MLNTCQSFRILQRKVVWALEDCTLLIFEEKIQLKVCKRRLREQQATSTFPIINQQGITSTLRLNICVEFTSC